MSYNVPEQAKRDLFKLLREQGFPVKLSPPPTKEQPAAMIIPPLNPEITEWPDQDNQDAVEVEITWHVYWDGRQWVAQRLGPSHPARRKS